ncbi:MAG: response regulator [Candidatus Omnitrophota bacterium]
MTTRILLIEDNPDYIMITKRILAKTGQEYSVDAVIGAQEGVKKIIEGKYNLILCDYRLPGMSGLEILRQMRSQGNDTPFVVVTSAGSEKIAVDLMQEGAADYVVKDSAYENILPMVIKRAIDRYDVKKEKQWLEQELINSNEKLKQMYAIKSDFTSMVSHELRTPLTAIREGISIVLDGSLGNINEDQKEFLNIAQKNVDRLKRLIDDVLDFSKLESKRMTFKVREDSLEDAIKDVVSTQLSVAKKKGLYLDTKISSDIPLIEFDRDRINQVLNNLVSNAIKFTETGGIVISCVNDPEQGVVRVSVEDTGTGISPEDIPKLFQKFQQLGGMDKRKTGGTGLGLAISKQIIEHHGGQITGCSELGKKSEFSFTLLIKRQYKVLVIDDEMVVLDVCKKFLEKDKYIVLRTTQGKEGIKLAQEEKPDAIVLDMRLQDMSGYEIIGRLKSGKETANIPILVISGYMDEIERIKAQPEDIALPWILKPLDGKQFLLKIKSLVHG